MVNEQRSSMLQRVITGSSISLLTLLIAVIVGEGALRLLPSARQAKYNSLFVYHDGYFELAPNSSVDVNGIQYKVNSEGLRDSIGIAPKCGGVERIALRGDSITFGYGVQLEQSYGKQLALALNQRFKNRKFESVNFGVSGLTTIGEVNRYFEKGFSYGSDYVVVEMLLDDFIYPQHQEESVNMGMLGAIKEFTKVYLYAIYFRIKGILNRVELVKQYPAATDLVGYIEQIYRDENAQLLATQNKLLELKNFTKARNQKLLVVLFPYLLDLPNDNPLKAIRNTWSEFFEKNGIEFIDLAELVPLGKFSSMRLEESDSVHPSAMASATIADLLAQSSFWDSAVAN